MTATDEVVVGTVTATGLLPLANLAIDSELMHMVRASGLDEEWAKELAEVLRPEPGKESLPEDQLPQLDPISVVDLHGNKRVVAHGFHRVRAYVLAKRTLIPAIVTYGDEEHLITTALQGNIKNGKKWPVAERKLALRVLFADERYNTKPFAWYGERTGLHPTTVSNEWRDLYPGMTERTVIGADGVAQVHKIGTGAKKATAPTPIAEGELDALYESSESTGITAPVVVSPTNGSAPIPVAQTTKVVPTPVAMNGHAPKAIGNGSAPSAHDMGSQYVQVRRPPVIHPTQALTSFTLYYQLADGTQVELDMQALESNQYPSTLPGAVRQALLLILTGGNV